MVSCPYSCCSTPSRVAPARTCAGSRPLPPHTLCLPYSCPLRPLWKHANRQKYARGQTYTNARVGKRSKYLPVQEISLVLSPRNGSLNAVHCCNRLIRVPPREREVHVRPGLDSHEDATCTVASANAVNFPEKFGAEWFKRELPFICSR